MLVSRETFEPFIATLCASSNIAVDTETTGLYPYRGDNFFSIIFATDAGQWYLNFQGYENCPESIVLGDEHLKALQERVFNDEQKRFFFFNAKFDLAFLAKRGIECRGRIHDTRSMYRIINNEAHIVWSLDSCAKQALGIQKSDLVDLFISEHGLWEWEVVPGKKKEQKKKFFHQVPLDIIYKYGLKDGEITFKLGVWTVTEFRKLEIESRNVNEPSYVPIYKNECELTETVFAMERRGVQIDRTYTEKCIDTLERNLKEVEAKFKSLTGEEYKDSAKLFEKVFAGETFVYGPVTATGKQNARFDSDTLKTFKNPASKVVLEHREIKSRLDFFQGFLFFADSDDILHTNFNQDGTGTGRFSSSNPNLQNLEKTEGEDLKSDIVVRRSIVPRPEYFFAMFDYDQVEYRLMLDLAEAMGLIKKIIGGLDVHQATADLARITRPEAKAVNFGVLYGMGDPALAANLKVDLQRAREIKKAIFDSAPEIESFINEQKYMAESKGYVINWFGRRCHFPYFTTQYGKKRMSHKAANYVIQGGCADIIKIAMNKIHRLLQNKKSKMVLSIHDELVIETHVSERDLLPEIKRIMESVYPFRHLPLTVGCDHSFISLADKVEGFPA